MDPEISAQEAQAEMDAGYSDAPTVTPEPTQAPVPEATPAPTPEPTPAPDPIKLLTERLDKFEATNSKLAGHIGGLQRGWNEIQAKLQAAEAAGNTVKDAPSQAQVDAAASNPKEWEELKEEYPQWGVAIDKFVASKMAAFKPQSIDPASIEKMVGERVAGQLPEVRKEIINASLEAVFPGWTEDVRTPKYQEWIKTQPDDVKALADSDKVADAAKHLRKFYADTAAPAPTPAPEPKKDTSTRQKRLEAAVPAKGAGGHASGGLTPAEEIEAGYNG